MPVFLVYTPDKPNNLAARLKVRAEHLVRSNADKASGVVELGRLFLPPPDAPPHGPDVPADAPNIAGSVMFVNQPSREAVWAWLQEDVYWKAGVWDQPRIIVEEFCPQ